MPEPTRRAAILGTASFAATLAAAPETLAWTFRFPSIEEGVLDFATLKGRVLLVANTASFCGYTYQYEALEALHASLESKGLTVVGMPSQDFNQESGTNAAVKAFCDATFGVQFPMAGLTHVRGANADPFYKWVKAQTNGWQPDWNFNKVLIGRDGRIAGTFGSNDEPTGRKLRGAVDKAMALMG
jgi:glutathione peroxidase